MLVCATMYVFVHVFCVWCRERERERERELDLASPKHILGWRNLHFVIHENALPVLFVGGDLLSCRGLIRPVWFEVAKRRTSSFTHGYKVVLEICEMNLSVADHEGNEVCVGVQAKWNAYIVLFRLFCFYS